MRFDFKTMEEKALPHFKGGEKELNAKLFADANNKILLGRLVPGATVGEHKHEGSSEIIFGLSGKNATGRSFRRQWRAFCKNAQHRSRPSS